MQAAVVEGGATMSTQLALNLAAASVGFIAAIFFCLGNAFNSPRAIADQATPCWDFNPALARALAAQRAQYIVGGCLLLVVFCLQVLAAVAGSPEPAALPRWLQSWGLFVATIVLLTFAVSATLSFGLFRATMRGVDLHAPKPEKT
jgi:hypothetical protein